MKVIPCSQAANISKRIDDFAEILKTRAHELSGSNEEDIYDSGVFRGAVERIRGQFSANMYEKRRFIDAILSYMQDRGVVRTYESAEQKDRFDFTVVMDSKKIVALEIKGCLDGNNLTIFDRPAHAQEFIIWSICSNAASDPELNTWSGIHSRLGPDIITNEKRVDGLIVLDWMCGSAGRQCPKTISDSSRVTRVANYKIPPPCLYLFPDTIPNTKMNPMPSAQRLNQVEFVNALMRCFSGREEEVSHVSFNVERRGQALYRRTRIQRNGAEKLSAWTEIRRS